MQEALQEHERVELFEWLLERFLELGFAPEDAELLAVSDVDYREAQALIAQGCPHPLALRILL